MYLQRNSSKRIHHGEPICNSLIIKTLFQNKLHKSFKIIFESNLGEAAALAIYVLDELLGESRSPPFAPIAIGGGGGRNESSSRGCRFHR